MPGRQRAWLDTGKGDRYEPDLDARAAPLPRGGRGLRRRQPAAGYPRQGAATSAVGTRRLCALAPGPGRPRLGRAHLARRARRHRLERAATADLRGRVLQGGRAEAAALRPVHDRTGADEVRQRRAAGRAAAAHHPRAGLVVPGLFGAGFGFGPGLAVDPRRARRRRVRGQRPEDLDHAGAIRRPHVLPGPHRSRRARPARHFHAAAGHASARRQRASDPDAGRWLRRQRSLAGKRARAGRQPGGEENQGWTYAKYLLGHERTGIAGLGHCHRELGILKRMAWQATSRGRPLLEDSRMRDRISRIEADIMALEMLLLRVAAGDGGARAPRRRC